MDEEFLSVLIYKIQSLTHHEIDNTIATSEGSSMMAIVIDGRHFQGLFCSKTGFNLSQRMVSKIEIQVLEKWIGICVFILD